MPTYDYVCDNCGCSFEKIEPMSSTPQEVCPNCNTNKLRRKIGKGGVIEFHGKGFHVNDYPKDE